MVEVINLCACIPRRQSYLWLLENLSKTAVVLSLVSRIGCRHIGHPFGTRLGQYSKHGHPGVSMVQTGHITRIVADPEERRLLGKLRGA